MGDTYVQYTPFYKTHTASAPGDAPNIDTGRLINSLNVTRSGSTSAEVLANVEYAAYLELGTRNMAARPFMTPAVEQERDRKSTRLNSSHVAISYAVFC